jgi:hypothetical protein
MDMKNKLVRSMVGAAVVLLFICGPTFAKTSHVNLIYSGKVGQLTLAPGTYRVKVNTASATPEMAFYRNGKFIGQTPVRVVSEARKNSKTMVYYNAPKDNVRRVTQIDLGGWKDKLVFGRNAA